MAFERITIRTLPDGTVSKVFPFHISLEGMESVLLCRNDEDYDHLEKSFYLAALKCNTLIIIGIALSNHAHAAILAKNLEAARKTGIMIVKRHSQYLSWKYSDKSILSRSGLDVRYLDSDWYVRNALAYVVRNALDTGCRIEDYPWSGYRGMFAEGRCPCGKTPVASLGRREREAIFHTHQDLSRVPWVLNEKGSVEPASACDYPYLESAFNHDQAFFLKTIGSLDPAEMRQKLVTNTRFGQTDQEMFAIIGRLAEKWFHLPQTHLTPEMKARLVSYLFRCYKTSIPQLARCLGLSRDAVDDLVHRRRSAFFVSPATEK